MNKKFQGLGAKLPSRPRAAARIRQTTRQSAYIAAILMGLSTSAHAQWAVFDAANFSQNVMTAARELQQINNQIQSLQNEAAMFSLGFWLSWGHVNTQACFLVPMWFWRQTSTWRGCSGAMKLP